MNPIRTNKPVFFADDGEPLASGYIYVGLPGQDPRNFPKTVTFRDSGGGEFTAAQPLRTNAQGQISYNGKAIIALVEGDYSLLIEDRTGTQTKSGWTPVVDNTAASGGGGGGTTEVGVKSGVLLGDIKMLDVSPGDIVTNAGKNTALDRLGAEWLVVANTGTPGDDSSLIDFSNARQGRRIRNQIYHKDILATGLFLFDAPSVALSGSGAAYIGSWNTVALPAVPAEADSAVIRVGFSALNGSGTINGMEIQAYARRTGSAAPAGAATRIGRASEQTNNATAISVSFTSEITVPMAISGAESVDIYLSSTQPVTSSTLDITVVGYTINARSAV